MLDKIPTEEQRIAAFGAENNEVWLALCEVLDTVYEVEHQWDAGGKKWDYINKCHRDEEAFCALLMKQGTLGFMVVLNPEERGKFEAQKSEFSQEVQDFYDNTKTFHDAKTLTFRNPTMDLLSDFKMLLALKG